MKSDSNSSICKESLFADFFKNHAKALRNFMYYKFGNEDLADDVTQEAFIKLWQNCKDVPIEKAKAYIYTIANNTTLNVISHQKVVLAYEKKHPGTKHTIESPEFLLEETEFKNKLLVAIQNLGEAQRVAFLMHRVDGKKYSEIAEALNISVKAVEKRIHQALVELRKEIDALR